MAALGGKLTKKLVENLGPGRHGDGSGLYLVVDPSGARRWVVRVTVKGQRNAKGAPLRTDFGLGGADVVALYQARERALEYRRMAKSGLNPRYNAKREVPTFEELSRQVHIERLPTWKNPKHGQQWLNTLRDYAFPKIGRMPVDAIGQPEVLMCLSPIWTDKHETARRLAQRIKTVLDVARSHGFREGENPVTAVKEAGVLPKVKAKGEHHEAMPWSDVSRFYAELEGRDATAARALQFAILTASRTSEVLGMTWEEIDLKARLWTVSAARMKGGVQHRVPLTDEMLRILERVRPLASAYVFEGQKRHRPLSNMSMLMLLRRMGRGQYTVHGFRSTFRDWAAEEVGAPREVAEAALAHQFGSEVERAYARSDLLERRRRLAAQWCSSVSKAITEAMDVDRVQGEEATEIDAELVNGAIDIEKLKASIQEFGPIRLQYSDTGLEKYFSIQPCLCGHEGCKENVISAAYVHGVSFVRSIIDERDLLQFASLADFLDCFFHYPEKFFSSSSDEQLMEMEIHEKLGVDPFVIYSSDDVSSYIVEKIDHKNSVNFRSGRRKI